MKRKLAVGALVALLVCGIVSSSLAIYFMDKAITVYGKAITTDELEEAMLRHQIEAALSSASYGYAYKINDRLNFIDALDKVIFDLEMQEIIQSEATVRGIDGLPPELAAQAREEAHQKWLSYLEIVRSENGRAYLPAGTYTPDPEHPEENAILYLHSFGLTEEALVADQENYLLETLLQAKVCESMPDADEDERLEFYTDWMVECLDSADIEVDPIAVAEVSLKLAGWE